MTASRLEEMLRALAEGKSSGATAHKIAKRHPGGLAHNSKWMVPSGWKDNQQSLARRLSSLPDYPQHRASIQGLLDRLGLYKEKLPEPTAPKPSFTAEDLVGVLQFLIERQKDESVSRPKYGVLPLLVEKTGFSKATLDGWIKTDGSLSNRRTVKDLTGLPRYAEYREQLQDAFEQLGHTKTADELPEPSGGIVRGEMTADILADLLAKRAANPTTSMWDISREISVAGRTLRKYIDLRTGRLRNASAGY